MCRANQTSRGLCGNRRLRDSGSRVRVLVPPPTPRFPQLASPRGCPPSTVSLHSSEKGRPLPTPVTPSDPEPCGVWEPRAPRAHTQDPRARTTTRYRSTPVPVTGHHHPDQRHKTCGKEAGAFIRASGTGRAREADSPQPGGRPIPNPGEPRNRASHAAAGEPTGARPSLGFVSVSCWRRPGVTEPRRSHQGPSKLRRITEIPGKTACDGRAIRLQTQRICKRADRGTETRVFRQ